jgi:hypothetical protein
MIHTHTMTQLKTIQDDLKLLSSTNITTGISYTVNVPASAVPASSGPSRVIPNTSLSYLKIIPVFKSSVTTPRIRVTGWSKAVDSTNTLTHFVPLCLFEGTITIDSANSFTVNADNTFRVSTSISKNTGDGKIYNSTGVNDTGFIIVDTTGSQYVEIEFITGSAVTGGANAFIGGM